jgi:hypothetical protein
MARHLAPAMARGDDSHLVPTIAAVGGAESCSYYGSGGWRGILFLLCQCQWQASYSYYGSSSSSYLVLTIAGVDGQAPCFYY